MFDYGAFLSYAVVITFTPGPSNILSLANAGKYGCRQNQSFAFGVFWGFMVIMVLCCFGNLVLCKLFPEIKNIMSWFGAVYMLYLALHIATAKKKFGHSAEENELSGVPEVNNNENSKLFFTGMTIQFVNPKLIIYAITIMSNFVIPHWKDNIILLIFCSFLSFLGYAASTSWSLFGVVFKRFLAKNDKLFKIILVLLLIYCMLSMLDVKF
jgi:threonine/homoserine/homoserine lactone efflux protein